MYVIAKEALSNVSFPYVFDATDPLHLAGSGSTSIPALDPDSDPDPLNKALIWVRIAPKLFRVTLKSKTKCYCYRRNAFSKFWR